MNETKPTEGNLNDPYVLQLIATICKLEDEIEGLTEERDRWGKLWEKSSNGVLSLQYENKKLRKIASCVPVREYIAAKEKAGIERVSEEGCPEEGESGSITSQKPRRSSRIKPAPKPYPEIRDKKK